MLLKADDARRVYYQTVVQRFLNSFTPGFVNRSSGITVDRAAAERRPIRGPSSGWLKLAAAAAAHLYCRSDAVAAAAAEAVVVSVRRVNSSSSCLGDACPRFRSSRNREPKETQSASVDRSPKLGHRLTDRRRVQSRGCRCPATVMSAYAGGQPERKVAWCGGTCDVCRPTRSAGWPQPVRGRRRSAVALATVAGMEID